MLVSTKYLATMVNYVKICSRAVLWHENNVDERNWNRNLLQTEQNRLLWTALSVLIWPAWWYSGLFSQHRLIGNDLTPVTVFPPLLLLPVICISIYNTPKLSIVSIYTQIQLPQVYMATIDECDREEAKETDDPVRSCSALLSTVSPVSVYTHLSAGVIQIGYNIM